MEVQAFLLCDSVMRDSQSGKTVLTGIFDRIWVRSIPAAHSSCAVYFRIRFDQSESTSNQQLALRITPPSGLSQTAPEIPLTVANNFMAEGSISIAGLPLPEEGEYEIELLVSGNRVSRYFLTVNRIEVPHGTVH